MEQKHFDRIASSPYALITSFALWDPADIANREVIPRNVSRLTTAIAIVGLNGAGDSPDPQTQWRSYHCRHQGCKDYYLCEAFQVRSTRFTGAYMTDLVKDSTSTNQKEVLVLPHHLADLVQELEFVRMVDTPSPLLIALGDKVYDALTGSACLLPDGSTFVKHIQERWHKPITIAKVPHHAAHGFTKDQYAGKVIELTNTIATPATD
jgi:hypothetical protein